MCSTFGVTSQPAAFLLLVLLAEQIVHRLHGVEGLDGHFDEDGDPVGHGAVPEAGQFQSLQLLAIFALIGDEATVKTFYKEEGHIRLQPENDTMEPMYFDNVTILGKAIGLYRKL